VSPTIADIDVTTRADVARAIAPGGSLAGPVIGISGSRRNAACALYDGGQVLAVCELERLTRTKRIGLAGGELPRQAIESVLGIGGYGFSDITAYAAAEFGLHLPSRARRYDHHLGHAATAFWTSPFDETVVLVCDTAPLSEVSVWRCDGAGIRPVEFPWSGPGLASLYTALTAAFGFAGDAEHRFEALARASRDDKVIGADVLRFRADHLEAPPDFAAAVSALVCPNDPVERRASIAGGIQRHFGRLLVELVRTVRTVTGGANLCLAGGLFYNSAFTTEVAQSGLFARTFVPINPGNAGVCVGTAMAAGGPPAAPRRELSPFLGPSFSQASIKAVLDNCKLSYEYMRDGEIIESTVEALRRGRLVGWFHGRMEWGTRALGHRSILADPTGRYTRENLNRFLKDRAPYTSYGVSVCVEDAPRYFAGPPASPFMDYEYRVGDPDRFAGVMANPETRLRVHTVGEEPALLRTLLKAFGAATGTPVLANTSFNGFHEPIVCTPATPCACSTARVSMRPSSATS